MRRNRRRRALAGPGFTAAFVLTLLCSGGRSAATQDAQPQKAPVYAVNSQLVQIFLTVQEGSRRITGLKVPEFNVAEDGKAQPVDHMDSEEVPLQVALLLDTSESMAGSMKETQEAASLFVESMKPGDRVTLIPFNSNIRAIPQLTDDFEPILRAIRGTRAEYRTKLYDAILYAMKILSDKEGRKAIVVFSDGEDTASTTALPLVLNAASRYGFPIYSVSAGADIHLQPFRQVLRQLTETNHGKVFFAENPQELRSAFLEVSAELRAAYVLYYYTRLQPDDRWHELVVKVGNPRYKVYSRRGFFLGKTGTNAAAAKNMEKLPAQGLMDVAAAKESAKAALDEVVTPPAVPRPVDREAADNVTVSTSKSKMPTFKVESRLVEVPVFVESINGKEPPLFAEKDFGLYEDGSRRDIAYFKSALNMEDLPKARDLALRHAGTIAPQDNPSLSPSSGEDLTLGKYYLVLDDITTDVITFAHVKKAAEELIKKYHNPIRPFTVYFTSKGRGNAPPGDLEAMLAEIRKANTRSNRAVAGTEPINSYEAVLIDRGDAQAQALGEMRTAAILGLRFQNSLGIIDGACDCDPSPTAMPRGETALTCDPKCNEPVIHSTLQSKVAELLMQNTVYVRAALGGLREVVNLAAADTGNYSKTIIFISPGFVAGRDSRGDVSGLLQSIAATAKMRHVSIHAVDIGGVASEAEEAEPAIGTLANAPQVQAPLLASHSSEWQFEKSTSLDTLAQGSGGTRVKADNDITAAVGSAASTTGALYYLAFLSRQPTDGRFHKIGVFVSSRAVRLHARQGYYARPQTEKIPTPSSGASNEEVNAVLARVDAAMKSKDYATVANGLETLKWKFADKPDYWYNLGVAYFNLKDSMKAVESLQQAWALSPEDRTTGLMLSRAFAAAGNGDAAAETLQTMRMRHPLDLELLMQLGRVYESSSQPARAYDVYRSALDISPTPPLDFYILLIRTSAILGRSSEAGVFINDYRRRGGAEERIAPWTHLLAPDSKP